MTQNTSHAVMAQRHEPRDSLDDFPTPPWATRALIKYVVPGLGVGSGKTIWEPACGRGHMAETLKEFSHNVAASDIHDYGYGDTLDFLEGGPDDPPWNFCSWVITNPPYRLASLFASTALKISKEGVALFTRLQFLESIGRYERLFRDQPPDIVAPFVERVPINKGKVRRENTTATAYCWLVWMTHWLGGRPTITWIPPSRRKLERNLDYDPEWPPKRRV